MTEPFVYANELTFGRSR